MHHFQFSLEFSKLSHFLKVFVLRAGQFVRVLRYFESLKNPFQNYSALINFSSISIFNESILLNTG